MDLIGAAVDAYRSALGCDACHLAKSVDHRPPEDGSANPLRNGFSDDKVLSTGRIIMTEKLGVVALVDCSADDT